METPIMPIAPVTITIDDFKKMEIKIGEILSAEKVHGADKLIKFSVNVGEAAPRQILSGIALHVADITSLVGKKFPFVTNLAPRTIRGFESNGMILAVSDSAGKFSFIEPKADILAGSRVG
jgi:methionyl-tRNA synthetase